MQSLMQSLQPPRWPVISAIGILMLAGCAQRLNHLPEAEITDSVGMRLRYIAGGAFEMGSTTGQPDECPVHTVTVSPFYLGVFEVTQAQYERVMEENPSVSRAPEHPVGNVTWHDAVEFCARLSAIEGVTYRLPTEAEWEFASLAPGCATGPEFIWGDKPTPAVDNAVRANVADESFAERFPDRIHPEGYFQGFNDGYSAVSPVGSFPPDARGLYDMAGNVFEWCKDVYGLEYYRQAPAQDPQGPEAGPDRCMRGGNWSMPRRWMRRTGRFRDSPQLKAPGLGFRCVREVR